ncbi:hypothetical protein BC628DRAFT_587038 [Trametes gibbosa]|nr:hypothetical protein BC628DRAFT_587038 [Trametes gibbosa]
MRPTPISLPHVLITSDHSPPTARSQILQTSTKKHGVILDQPRIAALPASSPKPCPSVPHDPAFGRHSTGPRQAAATDVQCIFRKAFANTEHIRGSRGRGTTPPSGVAWQAASWAKACGKSSRRASRRYAQQLRKVSRPCIPRSPRASADHPSCAITWISRDNVPDTHARTVPALGGTAVIRPRS